MGSQTPTPHHISIGIKSNYPRNETQKDRVHIRKSSPGIYLEESFQNFGVCPSLKPLLLSHLNHKIEVKINFQIILKKMFLLLSIFVLKITINNKLNFCKQNKIITTKNWYSIGSIALSLWKVVCCPDYCYSNGL